ncbi:hypothetical protein QFC22_003106 [Naganishia vaughanmartiniae]|uniref:Uncharacterized protein n=1 Tax=Naganishia vaughanmartiniae TaxID=1424756 RepID=A0ACC2XAV9_9TREE|nr:hypothetical protein QFC22_003106 [Naganishia vaughanmartiniae]
MAVDPLAGTSKPLPPRDILESRIRRPLQFAATLLPTDDPLSTLQQQQQNNDEHRTRPRREIERVPGVPLAGDVPGSVNEAKDEIARLLQDVKRLNLGPTSGDAHSGARPSFGYDNTQRSSTPALGSTEWLESRISALIFDADTNSSATAGDAATLDLSGLQMRVLSDKIGELQDMTRLAKRSYDRRPEFGPPQTRAPSVPLGNRQFKRYTSAPVTTSMSETPGSLVTTIHARPPVVQTGVTPRAVSGPARIVPAYTSPTDKTPQRTIRARSGLSRELSSTSSASSASSAAPGASTSLARHGGMSRHSSRGSVTGTALGEGDSFASTSSGATLVEEEEEGDAFGDSVAVGKGKMLAFPSHMDSQVSGMSAPSGSQQSGNSPLWQFKKAHHEHHHHQAADQPSANATRTFIRSSSAMLPLSNNSAHRTSMLPDPEPPGPLSRRPISGKTVSFANLGIGGGATPSPSATQDQSLPPAGSGLQSPAQGWSRSASGTWNPVERTTWKGASKGDVQLILSNNMLTCLPSTLFQVTNLVVLTLRHNQLTELPGAINELKNLKELNVSNNKIASKTLPPAILDLENLEQFTFVNTDLERSPDPAHVMQHASGRKLEPLIIRRPGVASLRSMALSVLLSSRLPHSLPPILTSIDWEPSPEERGTRNAVHGLYDAYTLAGRVPCLTTTEARGMIAAARAAYRHSSSSRKHDDGIPNPAFSGAAARVGLVPRDPTDGEQPDDAAANPYFSPCPNPAHGSVFTRKLYVGEPAVERIEWTRVNGADKEVPIRWKGCSVECLDFLEMPVDVLADDDDEDGLSDTDVEEGEEVGGVLDEDGFDADVLGGDDPF